MTKTSHGWGCEDDDSAPAAIGRRRVASIALMAAHLPPLAPPRRLHAAGLARGSNVDYFERPVRLRLPGGLTNAA